MQLEVEMLGKSAVMPTIPASDMERAKDFYSNKLGLATLNTNKADGGVMYKAGEGTALFVYKSAGAGTSQATYASFKVDDLASEMQTLRDKGVVFEEYDMPGLKTDNGVATYSDNKAAWFKDSEGNILALDQMG
jgi:predicted enzyme related to lactoylglutathione lyase